MKISFAKPATPTSENPSEGALVLPVFEGKVLTAAGSELDLLAGGTITKAIAASRFEGKKDQSLNLPVPAGLAVSRLLLVGVGKPDGFDALAAEALGGASVAALAGTGDSAAQILVDGIEGTSLTAVEIAARAAYGALLRSYRFDKYQTKVKKEEKPALKKLTLALADSHDAKKRFASLEKVAEGVFLTRDLVSEPANVIYPESFAAKAKELAELGIEVEILGEKELKKLGARALLGVGQGSDRDSQLVVLRWNGAGDVGTQPIAFVGKGVTFDSGGISIKPAEGMEDMKWDMGGAGVVVGLLKALAGRKAKVNVIGVVGLVENMPSGTAQRPGDVVTALSGETIEVINTDAEGRLVLADALWYTQDRFKPKFLVDLATLTGAIIISLGTEYAGLFSNNDELADRLTQAGKSVGEKLWRLPVGEAYEQAIKSDIADIKNTGGRPGGSITAATFLKHFVNDVPWAHLDIAGVTWGKKDGATTPKGASAFGVRLLDELVASFYEE